MGKIGEYATFQNGFAFKSKDFKQDGDYRVIKIKELKDGTVKIGNDTACHHVDDVFLDGIEHGVYAVGIRDLCAVLTDIRSLDPVTE